MTVTERETKTKGHKTSQDVINVTFLLEILVKTKILSYLLDFIVIYETLLLGCIKTLMSLMGGNTWRRVKQLQEEEDRRQELSPRCHQDPSAPGPQHHPPRPAVETHPQSSYHGNVILVLSLG